MKDVFNINIGQNKIKDVIKCVIDVISKKGK